MADIVLFVDEKRYNELLEFGLDSSLGYFFHNIAVMCFPYDTGNARSAISLSRNTPRLINIQYNLLKANYIKFLEEGIGPVTKHKGVISVKTHNAILEPLMGYLIVGTKPTFIAPPVVALRRSQYRPFGAKSSVTGTSEKDILRQADMLTYGISGQARGLVSKVRETTYRTMMGGKLQGSLGVKTEVTVLEGQRTRRLNRNMSVLRAIVNQKKKEYLANREEANNLAIMNIK